MAYSLEKGTEIVELARSSVREFFRQQKAIEDKRFREKRGVFVTISTFSSKRLRGCIGFIEPIYPLSEGIIKSSLSAAFSDPRFPPLDEMEMEDTTFEVSVLTVPEECRGKKEELAGKIEIGKHGIILKNQANLGVFLPQVAEEWHWDAKTFLEEAGRKAGLDRQAWKRKDTRIFVFSAQVFRELSPGGKVVEEKEAESGSKGKKREGK